MVFFASKNVWTETVKRFPGTQDCLNGDTVDISLFTTNLKQSRVHGMKCNLLFFTNDRKFAKYESIDTFPFHNGCYVAFLKRVR